MSATLPSELVPGWPIVAEDRSAHHWVGACGNIVLVFAYEGSHDDEQHALAAARLVERLSRTLGAPVRLLFVLPPRHSRPPNARVRAALIDGGKRLEGQVSRLAVVVAGSGFGAAIHRGALTGIMTVLRPKIPIKIVADLVGAVDYLLEGEPQVREPLLRLCQELLGAP